MLSVASIEGLDGHSIKDAQTAQAAVRIKKAENRLLDIRPTGCLTFNQLTEWYLSQKSVQAMDYYLPLGAEPQSL